MKKYFLKPSLLSLVSLITFTHQVHAQQQCSIGSVVETTPTSRFTINADGTVTDTKTNLIWARCPQGVSGANCTIGSQTLLSWSSALALAGSRPTSVTSGAVSNTDWRVPNIKELASLVERACVNPAINETVFPNATSGVGFDFFWSSSPFDLNSSTTSNIFSLGVFFNSGVVNSINRLGADTSSAVRLVRNGP